jgi:hypothetical protein
MSNERKDGGLVCKWCERPAHIKQGRILLCAMHYRISSMSSRARRDGKTAPSRAEIEAILPNPFICKPCGRPMNWVRDDGASTQATLQHDRNGEIRIICLACNTKHAQHPGDSYYDLPGGHKRCPDCEQILPVDAFVIDKSRPVGRKSYCRKCSSIRHKSWRSSHAVA